MYKAIGALSGHMKTWKETVKVLDNGKCYLCGDEGKIIHHYDGDSSNNTFFNLYTLCCPCHSKITMKHRKGNPTGYLKMTTEESMRMFKLLYSLPSFPQR